MSKRKLQYGSPSDSWMESLRAHRLLILGTVVMAMLAALLFSLIKPHPYRTDVDVLLSPAYLMTQGGTVAGEPINVQTEAQLVESSGVVEAVKEELGGTLSARSLRSSLEVRVIPETELITISFTHPRQDLSRRAAASFAAHYLDLHREIAAENASRAVAVLEARVGNLRAQLAELGGEQGGASDSADRDSADTQRQALVFRIATIEESLNNLQPEALSFQTGHLLSPGRTLLVPTSVPRNVAVAGVLGLIAALGLVLLLGRRKVPSAD